MKFQTAARLKGRERGVSCAVCTHEPSSILYFLSPLPRFAGKPQNTVLVPVSKSRKISCHLPSNVAPTSSSLQHSCIQDKSPSHPTSSPAQVTESPPCPPPPSPHWPRPQRLSPRSIPLSDGRGKGSWAKCLFVEELNHKNRKEIPFFWSLGVFFLKFQQKGSARAGKPQPSSHRGILGI